jgi:hypothetical protein
VFALSIREVQKALNEKADEIQREFVQVSEELSEMGRKLLELRGEEANKLRLEQQSLRAHQQELAEEINLWRDRSRKVQQQRGLEGMKAFITSLLPEVDEVIRKKLERVIQLIDMPEEELADFLPGQQVDTKRTPAGRLIERARVSYELRVSDSSERARAAVEFANQSGMALNDEVLAEIEQAIDDDDPMVKEVAILTTIQLHRFRAIRTADLDIAHQSVKKLTGINHPAVIPVLIEIVEKPRTGFVSKNEGAEEVTNVHSRMIALLRLVEWHTEEAQKAVQMRRFDQNQQIVRAANRALELFPGTWTGPIKGK